VTDGTWSALRRLLVDRYDDLRIRLARRLGSAELAAETLQATYLRLDRTHDANSIRNPEAYLYRVALNVAADHRQAAQRQLGLAETEALRHLDDDELDPARVVEARAEIGALARALDELPPRCKAIFLAARLHDQPHSEIAAHFGISVRMIERELKRALEHCRARLDRRLKKC
jgi:RNA polymerase sigma-70 factor (ECF subfamily)